MNPLAALLALLSALTCLTPSASFTGETSAGEETHLIMQPIGRVQKSDDRALIVLNEQYQPGLLGLEGFTHIHVLWWFDRNDRPEKRRVLPVHRWGTPRIRSPASSPPVHRFARTWSR